MLLLIVVVVVDRSGDEGNWTKVLNAMPTTIVMKGAIPPAVMDRIAGKSKTKK